MYNKVKVPDSENSLTNVPYKRITYNGWNPDEKYMPHPARAENSGRVVSYKGLQASKGEISPYTPYLTPSGQFRGIYPTRVYKKVNYDRGTLPYNRPLLSREDMGYTNPPRISNKVDFNSGFHVYDGFQAARPDPNNMYPDIRLQLQRFRRPSSGQTKIERPGSYGGSSEWTYKKNTANEGYHPNNYMLIRSIRDNSTVRERGDPTLEDNFAPIDSYVDPDDYEYYLIDLKKRFKADYNILL